MLDEQDDLDDGLDNDDDNDDLREENQSLKSKLADYESRAAFNVAAKSAGVDPRWTDDLFRLSELRPGDDSADFLIVAKASHDWAFAPASAPRTPAVASIAPAAPPAPTGKQ